MKKLLSLSLLALTPSCVTSGDLAKLEASQLLFEGKVESVLSDTEKTNTEKLEDIRDANAVRLDEVGDVLSEVQDRTESLVSSASSGPLGLASGLVELLAGLAVTGAGTYVAVNKKRDKKYAPPAG